MMIGKVIASIAIQWAIVIMFYLFCYFRRIKPSSMWSRNVVVGIALVLTVVFILFFVFYALLDVKEFLLNKVIG